MAKKYRFFSPIMKKDDVAACAHCEACKHACLTYTVSTTIKLILFPGTR